MYIVTRTFRDANGVFSVGSVVEPTDVKAFKSRLQQRHIVNVDEQNIEKWATFFINRFGIDLADVLDGVASTVSQDRTHVEEPSEALQDEVVEEVSEEVTSEVVKDTNEEAPEEVTSEVVKATTEEVPENSQHMDSENESW